MHPENNKRVYTEISEHSIAEQKTKKRKISESEILHSFFTAPEDSISDEEIQEAIDAGLSINLWSKISKQYRPDYAPQDSIYDYQDDNTCLVFHSWLADKMLRVQKRNSEIIAHAESVVDLTQTPEGGEEEGGFENSTAAWNELTRLENFEKYKEDNLNYKEFLAVKKFEETKHDDESYQGYMARKDFEDMKKKNDPLYQEY